jgi:hypothetical protein
VTPVDLQSYSSWKQDTGERVAVAGGSRMTFSRRSVLELPIAPTPALTGEVESSAPGAEFEPVSPLDVPAFLRRQSEA